MRTRVQLRRATCLFAYWRDGQLFFHNYARRLTVSARPVALEGLAFFCKWRTSEEAPIHFSGYTQKSVLSTLSQFVKHGLLVVKNSQEALQERSLVRVWSAWLPEGGFHFSTKDAPFIGGKLSVARLKAILPKTPQPKIF